jgi:hypothetical protein
MLGKSVAARSTEGPLRRNLLILAAVAAGILAWSAVATLQRRAETELAEAISHLADRRVWESGPVEIADCGAKGCVDAADNVFRFATPKGGCFIAADLDARDRLVGETLGTGFLVSDARGRFAVVLVEPTFGSLAAVAKKDVARRPCPSA